MVLSLKCTFLSFRGPWPSSASLIICFIGQGLSAICTSKQGYTGIRTRDHRFTGSAVRGG
jgi:hypothetical protein